MKRLDIIIKSDKLNAVVSAIRKLNVGGVTVMHSQGQGAQEPPLVGQYYSGETIVAVVDDSKVDAVLDAVASVACTGAKGDGKVFVTNIEEALDICTKERGAKAI